MQFISKISVCLFFSAVTVGGCATTAGPSAHFGTATQTNKAAHAVAATAEEKSKTYIPADKSRQALAIEKYRKNEVTPPVPQRSGNN